MDIVVNANAPTPPEKSTTIQEPFYWNLIKRLHKDGTSIPLANFLARLNGRKESDWIIVSPIHCQATHNDAFITAYGDDLALSEEESVAIFSLIKDFLAEEVSEWLYYSPSLWLARLGSMPSPKSVEPHTIFHQSLLPHLRSLDDTHAWLRLFTEIQMLLAAQSKEGRQASTKVNALWFWGQGALALQGHKVFCEDHHLSATLRAFNVSCVDNITEADTIVLLNADARTTESMRDWTKNKSCNWYWNNKTEKVHAQTVWQRIRGIFS